MEKREVYEEIVKHPGKFEGEAPYVPYFYDVFMSGLDGDDYGNAGIIFTVKEDDLICFPELKIGDEIGLFFSDQGFVYEVEPKDIRQVYNETAEGERSEAMTRDEYNEIQSEFEKLQESFHYLKQVIKEYSPDTYKKLKNAFTYINTGIPADFNQFVDNVYTLDNAIQDMESEIEEDTPQEDDYVTEDYRKWFQYGKLVLDLTEEEAESDNWKKCLKDHMDQEKYWPSVWWISDHGNAHLLSLEESNET